MKDIKAIVAKRGEAYGPPRENHERTALLWTAYYKAKFKHFGGSGDINDDWEATADDVCFLNILQKIARCLSQAGPKANEDGIRDIQGYAENLLIINHFEDCAFAAKEDADWLEQRRKK